MHEVIDTPVTVETVIVPAPVAPSLTVGKSRKAFIESVNPTVHLFGRDRTQKGRERKGVTHVLIQGRAPSLDLSRMLSEEGFSTSVEPDRVLGGQSLLLSLQGQPVKGWTMPNRLRKSILAAIARNGGVDLE